MTSCRDDASTDRAATAKANVQAKLSHAFGCPVFIRIIKEKRELELHIHKNGTWQLLHRYPIAGMSGTLGPKTAEGDKQAPEGFYQVYKHALNPRSSFHLSFNIGYPNAYDRSLGRTGSFIMVHGSNRSIGCFAMTDPGIEEIYTLVKEALDAGQEFVPVQIYPFEMTDERMAQEGDNPHYKFWQYLRVGWQHTHQHKEPYPHKK